MYLDPEQQKQLVPLKVLIADRFTSENWHDLGANAGAIDIVQDHPRLLRSLSWQDKDYPGNVMEVLVSMIGRDPENFNVIKNFVATNFPPVGISISSFDQGTPIYFTPSVFRVPTAEIDARLVAVMMPFTNELKPVSAAINDAAKANQLNCQRVDDIWDDSTVIQDIFSLIFRSSIVVCDFSGRNPNVFYECGIAHTLGKHVVPIAQHESDVPFDLRHHRYLSYHNNVEGLAKLTASLTKRFETLAGK